MPAILLTTLVLVKTSAWAAETDHVPAAYRKVAAAQGIPSALFYAVALAESGRSVSQSGGQQIFRPWPWTLNIQGEGHFYASRAEAVTAFRNAVSSGRHSVDIGLMQVNWRYHSESLGQIERAIDPHRNLNVAAAILRACYQSHRDWWEAVGCYHSPNAPDRAIRYRERVRKLWAGVDAPE